MGYVQSDLKSQEVMNLRVYFFKQCSYQTSGFLDQEHGFQKVSQNPSHIFRSMPKKFNLIVQAHIIQFLRFRYQRP